MLCLGLGSLGVSRPGERRSKDEREVATKADHFAGAAVYQKPRSVAGARPATESTVSDTTAVKAVKTARKVRKCRLNDKLLSSRRVTPSGRN